MAPSGEACINGPVSHVSVCRVLECRKVMRVRIAPIRRSSVADDTASKDDFNICETRLARQTEYSAMRGTKFITIPDERIDLWYS
jgi:hypothetical protein